MARFSAKGGVNFIVASLKFLNKKYLLIDIYNKELNIIDSFAKNINNRGTSNLRNIVYYRGKK